MTLSVIFWFLYSRCWGRPGTAALRQRFEQPCVQLADSLRTQPAQLSLDLPGISPQLGDVHLQQAVSQRPQAAVTPPEHLQRTPVAAPGDLVVGQPDLQQAQVEVPLGGVCTQPGLFQEIMGLQEFSLIEIRNPLPGSWM